jgi:cysteine-rich repeat protein
VDEGEACDDGNQVDNDGCSNACVDGIVEGANLADWRAFDFRDRGHKDGCAGGDKYIKSTTYQGIYVGVTLCNAGRYKIWLSATINGIFESIGDGSGSGQDHCEFVGGTHQNFQVLYTSNSGMSGWTRGQEGQRPQHGTLSGAHWSPSWQECGVNIP